MSVTGTLLWFILSFYSSYRILNSFSSKIFESDFFYTGFKSEGTSLALFCVVSIIIRCGDPFVEKIFPYETFFNPSYSAT